MFFCRLRALFAPDLLHTLFDARVQFVNILHLFNGCGIGVFNPRPVFCRGRVGVDTYFTLTIVAGNALFDFHFGITEISGGDTAKDAGCHSAQFGKVSYPIAKGAASIGNGNAVFITRSQ